MSLVLRAAYSLATLVLVFGECVAYGQHFEEVILYPETGPYAKARRARFVREGGEHFIKFESAVSIGSPPIVIHAVQLNAADVPTIGELAFMSSNEVINLPGYQEEAYWRLSNLRLTISVANAVDGIVGALEASAGFTKLLNTKGETMLSSLQGHQELYSEQISNLTSNGALLIKPLDDLDVQRVLNAKFAQLIRREQHCEQAMQDIMRMIGFKGFKQGFED